MEIPRKYRNWHTQFFFVKVPSDLPLLAYWKNLWKGHSEMLILLDKEEDCVRCLMDVLEAKRTFKKLINTKALKEARLIDLSGVFSFSIYVFGLVCYVCSCCFLGHSRKVGQFDDG